MHPLHVFLMHLVRGTTPPTNEAELFSAVQRMSRLWARLTPPDDLSGDLYMMSGDWYKIFCIMRDELKDTTNAQHTD